MTRYPLTAATVAVLALGLPGLAAAEIYIGFGVGGSRVEADPGELGVLPNGGVPITFPPALPPPAAPPTTVERDQAAVQDFTGTNISTQFAVGWRSRYVGVEVGYVNFNQFSRSSNDQFYKLPNSPLIAELDDPPDPGQPIPPDAPRTIRECVPGEPPLGNPDDDFDNSNGCQEREWVIRYKGDGYVAALTGFLPITESIELMGKVGAIAWDSDVTGTERVRSINSPGVIPGGNLPVASSDDGTDLTFGVGAIFRTDSAFSVQIDANYYDIGNTDQILTFTVNAIYSFGRSKKE